MIEECIAVKIQSNSASIQRQEPLSILRFAGVSVEKSAVRRLNPGPEAGGGKFRWLHYFSLERSVASARPRRVKPSMPISSTRLSCLLHVKGYETYRAGATFGRDPLRRTR